jgi:hypothetical protein
MVAQMGKKARITRKRMGLVPENLGKGPQNPGLIIMFPLKRPQAMDAKSHTRFIT